MKRRIPFIVATVLATLFIFYNSMQSQEASQEASGIFANIVSRILDFIGTTIDANTVMYFVRKAAHISEFALQGILLAGCFSMSYKRRVIYVLFLGLLTACADEYIQVFAQNRSSMIQDVFIDFLGTVIGAVIFGLSVGFKRN